MRALFAPPAPPVTGTNLPFDQSGLHRLAVRAAVLTRGIAFRVEQPSHMKELPGERQEASSLWRDKHGLRSPSTTLADFVAN